MKFLRFALLALTAICLVPFFGCDETDDEKSKGDSLPVVDESPRWAELHSDGARTDSVRTEGIRQAPAELFSVTDERPSAFSGPVIGPAHEKSLGVGSKIYRVLGPGPNGFNPPPGIDVVVGTRAAVQVIHPDTGEILNEMDFNIGTFTTFASVDAQGAVYVPDWGRLQKFSGGMEELVWRIDFGGIFNGLANVPAGSIAFMPDGNVALPLLSGTILVYSALSGALLDTYDLRILSPPIAQDPQFGSMGVYLRNAMAVDGRDVFLLVSGELVWMRYDKPTRKLKFYARSSSMGFSSSSPTLDVQGKRLFLVTFDPNEPDAPPMLRCFDYSSRPIQHRWSIETEIAFNESEDQLTVTYLPEQRIIINNSFYGHLTAFVEQPTDQGPVGQRIWSTRETIGENVGAYISSATEPDGTIYFVENFTKTLYALDSKTGQPLWTHALPSQSIKTPIPNKGRLYIDHNEGLLALSKQ